MSGHHGRLDIRSRASATRAAPARSSRTRPSATSRTADSPPSRSAPGLENPQRPLGHDVGVDLGVTVRDLFPTEEAAEPRQRHGDRVRPAPYTRHTTDV